MPEESAGAGATATTTTTETTPSGTGAQGGTESTTAQQGGTSTQTPSANQLIKSFAAERGITVEALIDQFKELEDKGKTETERLLGERDSFKSKYETTEQTLRRERAERAVLTAATTANANDPDAILALASSRLEFDKDGKSTNVDAVIKALRDEKPERFRASNGSGDGGAGGQSGTGRDFNSAIREMARSAP